jgi:hypothetical protein
MDSTDKSSQALSIADVCRESGLGRTLIFAEIRAGKLVARKCGRRTLILKEDLLKWLQTLPVKTEACTTPRHPGNSNSSRELLKLSRR